MNDKQKAIDWLAVEVMGWTEGTRVATTTRFVTYYYKIKGLGYEEVINRDDYDPFTHTEQAFDLLGTFSKWKVEKGHPKYPGKYMVRIGLFGGAEHENKLDAICLAILRATGYESNGGSDD